MRRSIDFSEYHRSGSHRARRGTAEIVRGAGTEPRDLRMSALDYAVLVALGPHDGAVGRLRARFGADLGGRVYEAIASVGFFEDLGGRA